MVKNIEKNKFLLKNLVFEKIWRIIVKLKNVWSDNKNVDRIWINNKLTKVLEDCVFLSKNYIFKKM